jgi:hypothetical protein
MYNHKQVVAMAKMLASAWGTHLGTPPELCAAMAMVGLPPSINIRSQVLYLACLHVTISPKMPKSFLSTDIDSFQFNKLLRFVELLTIPHKW